MKSHYRKQFLFLFVLVCTSRGYSSNEDMLIYPGSIIIQKPYTSELNSMQMMNAIYAVKKKDVSDNIKSIETFYLQELNKRNFNLQKVDRKQIDDSNVVNLSMISKEKSVKVYIEDRIKVDIIYVKVNQINNISLFLKDGLDVNSKKDNPGFDFEDVPRSPGLIRLMSVKTDASKKDGLSQVSYKTLNHKNTLTQFYIEQMPKKGWISERGINQKTMAMLSFIKLNKKCSIVIIYHNEMKQNMVMIQMSEKGK